MMWTWWMTLLAVVLVLLLIGCIPVGVDAGYSPEGCFVKLKVWLARVTLLPRPQKQKKKPKKEKKEEAQKKAAKAPEEKKRSSVIPGGLDGIFSLVQLGCDVLGDFKRKLRVEKLMLHVTFGGDAAKAAINYGRAWAAIGALTPMLDRLFVIRSRDICPELCYEQAGMAVKARLVMTITIGRALSLALRAGVKFLKLLANNKKGGAKNEPSSV